MGDALEQRLQVNTAPEVRCLCFQLSGAQLLCTGGADATVRVCLLLCTPDGTTKDVAQTICTTVPIIEWGQQLCKYCAAVESRRRRAGGRVSGAQGGRFMPHT